MYGHPPHTGIGSMVERAREAGARVVEVDCKDKATAQNVVLWEIDTDVIIGFDGDTRPEPGCIELMMRDLNERGFDATAYRLGYAADAVALTVDPESFTVWRAQMRRWASGYAQNMAKYRRHLRFVPWFLVDFYTRWLYIAALFREWVLGRHYASWTGRQGRATVITPMTRGRKLVLAAVTALVLVAAAIGYAQR